MRYTEAEPRTLLSEGRNAMKFLIVLFQITFVTSVFAVSPDQVDVKFLRKYLPDYQTAQIFGPQYMSLLSENPAHQNEATEAMGGKYVIVEDLDGDGRNEVIVSGLVDVKPIKGNIVGFVAIFSMAGDGYKNVYFQQLVKPIESARGNTMSNLALFLKKVEDEQRLYVSFRIQTGWMFEIRWNKTKYEGQTISN
jgi:hypothetical protein